MRGLGSGVKSERVHFTSGNLSALSPPSQSWGARISIVTLLEMIDTSFSNELRFCFVLIWPQTTNDNKLTIFPENCL